MSCRSKSEWRQEVARLREAGYGRKEIARAMQAPVEQVANTLHTLRGAESTAGAAPGRVRDERVSPQADTTRPAPAPQGAVYREVQQPAADSGPPPESEMKISVVKSAAEQDLETLKRVEEAAWRQFEVSCQPRASVSKRKYSSYGDEETGVHDTVSQRETMGDARYLNIILKCVAQRDKVRNMIGLLSG